MEIVDNEIRDEIMEDILSIPENQHCFDCGISSPRWSSPYLGILLCIDCAGRHRSYGTHISFVKSVDLDKWNKKQLKSLELTGNLYIKKKFEEMGVPKIDSIYDYNNNLILEIRKEIDNLVKENLKPTDYTYLKKKTDNNNNIYDNGNDKENNNKNNIENEENDLLKPQKYIIKANSLKNNKNDKNKKNKIKKIDIDFNFDDYKEIPNNKLNDEPGVKEENVDPKKISGMKISRKDKKKLLMEKNKNKNNDNNQKRTCCEKLKEYIYNIIYFFKDKKS